MSKRAPSVDAVSVRRATQPSTASRTSATAVNATSVVTGGCPPPSESAVKAATPQASVARVSVTRSAGPSPSALELASPRDRAARVTSPEAMPTTQPEPLSPTVPSSTPSSPSSAISPIIGPD